MEIVLPVHDALPELRNCVDSVLGKTQEELRLIFVDDFSAPDVGMYLLEVQRRQPNTLIVRTGKQKWFTRAVNLGLRLVRQDTAVVLNSDCIVDVGWLDEMRSCWSEAEAQGHRVGLVGSTCSADEGRRWAASQEPGYVTGHAWLVSMGALRDIASRRGHADWYLDELRADAIHINSDRYGCYEMNRAGWSTIASFKSPVGHIGGRSWNYNLGKVQRLQLKDVD